MQDPNNYLVVRWIDNAEVMFVSNIHRGTNLLQSMRRSPRETNFNQIRVRESFGTEGATKTAIPESEGF
jgi:hypothetical protein